MENSKSVRVRFAPSPTGPLHIGGVRTALYNYLFAKKHGGTFLLRIEDTDQKRFVSGAEDHILRSLEWCGITPDESCWHGGAFGPYRQSERKEIYRQYIDQLLESGLAYYAFDTPEELERVRQKSLDAGNASWQYNSLSRLSMRNSLTLPKDEVNTMLSSGTPYAIRIKFTRNRDIKFQDLIRGWSTVNTNHIDDKVLFKSDGLPTYHFANVVDDHLMNISHIIRGEEWMPSTPLHLFLYECFQWEPPKFAHLPLILKPEGKGKLSKRDGVKFGFPVYISEWKEGENTYSGFEGAGFLPQGVVNFLALLGWNAGGDQEFFTLKDLISLFSLERVGKSGAKFDYNKAKWLNQKHLQNLTQQNLFEALKKILDQKAIDHQYDENTLRHIASLAGERASVLEDLYRESAYFFRSPTTFDTTILSKKWNAVSKHNLMVFGQKLEGLEKIDEPTVKELLKLILHQNQIKFGQLGPVLRIALTGRSGGPGIPDICSVLGKKACLHRVKKALQDFPEIG